MDSTNTEMMKSMTDECIETSANFLGFDCLSYTGIQIIDDEEFLIKHRDDES